jgi:glycosyltransferase involved in cell wall biosynthesis
MNSLPVSGVVITLNEAANIRRCLQSLAFCAERLIIDSGSTDDTTDIARSMGARVIHNDWPGFGRQKQFGVAQAGHDWVLCLDADEWVSDELAAAIAGVFATGPSARIYSFPRRNIFLGRPLRFGGGYPDRSPRLFHRGHAQWSDRMVHETVETSETVHSLQADLMHDTAPVLEHALIKWTRYTAMQAQDMYDSGVAPRLYNVFLNPWARFLKLYVLKQGFRDGVAGFALAACSGFFCFFKYLKLYQLHAAGRSKQ